METLIASRRLYEGRVLNLRVDDVRLPDGRPTVREIVEHGGAVAVVALDDDDYVLLIKQYRYAVGQVLIELPAGVLEPGEDPQACAARELEEETGCRAAVFEPLVTIYPSPGYTTEIIHLFIARHLEMGTPHPEADEYIELMRVPFTEALAMVERGEMRICNSIAIIGLLTAARKLGVISTV
ncbi:MAG: NUDIX hydrolase [Thermoflexales bacterium]|nr:NUDIX hydrolase [Thermoflexales bacterium]